MIKNVVLSFIMVLFLTGCVTTQEYAYEDDVSRKVKRKAEKDQITEKEVKRREEWIGRYLEKNNFVKQCPVCKRRYQDFLEKCPYDGAKLEKIKKEIE